MISVIIPVYNSEKYLERCIQSVINQTYTDWEMIIVNDGSTDKSEDIISVNKEKDSRIKSIWQRNAGAGEARNVGIRAAKGEYIVFVDSDDYIESTYFELLQKHNEDVVFINVNRRNEKGIIEKVESLSKYKSLPKDDLLRSQITGRFLWGGVRKAVKRAVLVDNNISFSNHRVGEEAYYSLLVLYYAKSISFIEFPVYNYELHKNSLSQSQDIDPWGKVALFLKSALENRGIYNEYASTENAFIIVAAIISIDRMSRCLKYSAFRIKAKERYRLALSIIDKTFPIDTKHIDTKILLLYHIIRMRLWFCVYIICAFRKNKND